MRIPVETDGVPKVFYDTEDETYYAKAEINTTIGPTVIPDEIKFKQIKDEE